MQKALSPGKQRKQKHIKFRCIQAFSKFVLQGTIVDMDIICINWTLFIYQSDYAESPRLEDQTSRNLFRIPYNTIDPA